jgi:hypothetical protein
MTGYRARDTGAEPVLYGSHVASSQKVPELFYPDWTTLLQISGFVNSCGSLVALKTILR